MSVTAGSGSYSTSISRGRLGGDLGRQRGDGRDDVALEAHALAREEPAVLDEVAVEDVRDVLVREHGEHARQRPRAGSRRCETMRACVWSA